MFETVNPSLVGQSISCAMAYYPVTDANKLLIAAYPLITVAMKLKNRMLLADVDNLQYRLARAIKRFEDEIRKSGYPAQVITDARYILCDFIDDMILQSSWAAEKNWQSSTLLGAFANETFANRGKYFFSALKNALGDPAANLDLLELMYVFLTLGYEGKYRSQQKGRANISKVTEDLCDCIDQYRVKLDQKAVMPECENMAEEIKDPESRGYFAFLTAMAIVIFGSFLVYLNFNVRLNDVVAPIYKEIVATSKLIEK